MTKNEKTEEQKCCEKEKCCDKEKQDCKAEKHSCKKDEIANLEKLVEQLTNDLKEQQTKANQYLSTASYYKNESENTKKDFERFKERNKNIEAEATTKAKEETAKKLLPIIDNFDQAIAHVDSEVMKGFSMIYSSLVKCLTDLGIVEIETDGKLDPEFHNCINTEPTEDESLDDTIASVYQKGYKFAESNKIVRAATVSVYKI